MQAIDTRADCKLDLADEQTGKLQARLPTDCCSEMKSQTWGKSRGSVLIQPSQVVATSLCPCATQIDARLSHAHVSLNKQS